MPPSSTPFRVPSSRRPNSSARPNTGPQFASTPRFVLSQQTPRSAAQVHGKDNLTDGDESSQSTPVANIRAATRDQDIRPTQRQKETIEDSDDELDYNGGTHRAFPDDITGSPDLDSSPPGDAGELEAEFEALFGPTTTRTKRRRASLDHETPFTQRRKHDDDIIQTSSPEGPSPTKDRTQQQFQTPNQIYPDIIPQRTTTTPQHSTPATIKPSQRNNPRFMSSASQAFSSTQPQPQPSSRPLPFATPGPTSPKRKPAFVLPRSPSPSQAAEDPSAIPTPFSPSSHTLRGRGRHRSAAPSYLPGGMAAEVRSWILEMSTKREQMHMNHRNRTGAGPDLQKYFLVIRIADVRQSALASSGPLAFVRGKPVTSLDDDEDASGNREGSEMRSILLLGAPRSQPAGLSSQYPDASRVPGLVRGNLVGVHRGLVWELDLEDRLSGYDIPSEPDSDGHGQSRTTTKWLVCMEWDLISVD
ncbi:hypothetical protein BDV37DRAFT_41302 [Aspergillus pseudonomiae]|uniref:Uncharacterized protein n=1 Tax=Aspergillus pseudonomiae TaxID=1506151 RepID=A0A5N7CWV0_9EURO|nr:uncharacterized protein BDV37DRAFT_41302 [Aspergillus pseudonomiae]KAE8398058.1 hypothetical protein BDV37DRAFT_41302 [Aspergillus pseudonomiae]